MELKNNIDGAGAYVIKCTRNGKVYVGSSSVSVLTRRDQHFAKLRAGKHYSFSLQYDFERFGESCFLFEVVALCENSAEAEQLLIKRLDATNPDRGYNSREIAYARSGRPKKDVDEVLVVLNVRVPQDVKKICVKWGKDKGKRIAAAIRAEKEKTVD